jgi:hypothetical protein
MSPTQFAKTAKNNAKPTPLAGISIQTEAAANLLDNHSIAGLTDAGNDDGWEIAA